MIKWHIVFKPEHAETAREVILTAPRTRALTRFKDAETAGALDGRTIDGMWIVDEATRQRDVVRIWGMVSHEIRGRHERYLIDRTRLKESPA